MPGSSEAIARYRSRLASLARVRLGHFPTPLDQLLRLSAELGATIMVKRDDCSGLAFGGNKVRQHEYVLGGALEGEFDCVVHGAAPQSNQSRQLAAAGARLGLDVYLLPKGIDDLREPQGNLLLDGILGARITPIGPEESIIVAKQRLARELVEQGRRPYVVGMGSAESLELAALAYVDALFEIVEQASQGNGVDWIYTASQGSTQAGLLAGCELLGLDTKVVGINPMNPDNEAFLPKQAILGLAQRVVQRLGERSRLTLDDVTNSTDFVGEAYGVPTESGLAATRLLASREGILLDPVYSSKAFAALVSHTAEGRISPGETVVFLHTGGLPVLFAYAGSFTSGVSSDCLPGTP